MKKIILGFIFIVAAFASHAQVDPTFKITSAGRTKLLNERYKVKAWVENLKEKGHVLKFTSSVSFSKAIIKRWMKNAQNQMVSDDQTTTFNPNTKSFEFMLDSPAYKGGLQYDLLLYVNANDADYAWRVHLVRN